VTQDFTAIAQVGEFSGTIGSGSFTYDDALIESIGPDSTAIDEGLMIEFTLFGQTFFETNDIDFPELPAADFFNGEVTFLDFIVAETFGENLTDITQGGIFSFSLGLVQTSIEGSLISELFINENLEVSPIPVPAAAWLFGSALLGFVGLRRKSLKTTADNV